jgi:hypothetical protein
VYTDRSTHVALDVSAAGLPVGFVVDETAIRLADSRPTGSTVDGQAVGAGRLAPGAVRSVVVAGRAGVPSSARAAVVSLTISDPSRHGVIMIAACGPDETTTRARHLSGAAVLVRRGVTTTRSVMVPLGVGGSVCVRSSASIDLAVDRQAWLDSGAAITTPAAQRIASTRRGVATADGSAHLTQRRSAGATWTVQVANRGGSPEGTRTAVLNLRAIRPAASGAVHVYACDGDPSRAVRVNVTRRVPTSALVVSRLDASGRVCIRTDITTHLVVEHLASAAV